MHDSPVIHAHSPAAATAANPLLVEVTRGAMVESRHRAAVAVCDADGKIVRQWGDIERPAYARSSIKPLQALPLIETGAADAFGLTPAEIALACASHSGEQRHVDTVRAWLARIGIESYYESLKTADRIIAYCFSLVSSWQCKQKFAFLVIGELRRSISKI